MSDGMHVLAREVSGVIQLCRMGHTITIRLDTDLAAWLEHQSTQTGVPQGKIVRDQLEKARAGASARGFMRLAGAVSGASRDLSRRKGFSKG